MALQEVTACQQFSPVGQPSCSDYPHHCQPIDTIHPYDCQARTFTARWDQINGILHLMLIWHPCHWWVVEVSLMTWHGHWKRDSAGWMAELVLVIIWRPWLRDSQRCRTKFLKKENRDDITKAAKLKPNQQQQQRQKYRSRTFGRRSLGAQPFERRTFGRWHTKEWKPWYRASSISTSISSKNYFHQSNF